MEYSVDFAKGKNEKSKESIVSYQNHQRIGQQEG